MSKLQILYDTTSGRADIVILGITMRHRVALIYEMVMDKLMDEGGLFLTRRHIFVIDKISNVTNLVVAYNIVAILKSES